MKSFTLFSKLVKNRTKPNNILESPGTFDEMLQYGYDTPENKVLRFRHITQHVHRFFYNTHEVVLVPWYDGVMLVHIGVYDRNKGTGTRVMNELYDISEESNIPIYLIPYPAENFDGSDEFNVISRLENWYRELGFDYHTGINSDEHPKVWCNFE